MNSLKEPGIACPAFWPETADAKPHFHSGDLHRERQISLLERLKRHPIPVRAFFRHSLVLTYAFPKELLEPLLPPGLVLDTFNNHGFVAIAMVQTEGLRPAFCPRAFGRDFFLAGYRIFARYKTITGRTLRGLRILRSDTNRRMMVFFGNRLTHYNYRLAKVDFQARNDQLEIEIKTPGNEADLHVVAGLKTRPASLPVGSCFKNLPEARLFAGPLPYTFDYERGTHSIIMIEGIRKNWKPQPVQVEVLKNTFFEHAPFDRAQPLLANAFHVENINYEWRRGIVEALPGPGK
ncbi:MAG TPA: DUF2071 domain-containing protein [Verrucomicrobiae bacterium]|jgi:hypothetical protein|nr:DUF2071 domain-containing protein [Verrucomicrobiae bacterium]